jgi:dTDP-4-dehydrorhamnose reductase
MVPTFGPNSFPRVASEEATVALAERGVNTSIVRLPQVHNTVKQGLVTYLIALAREKGVSAYVGDGLNRWPAAPLLDTARLYRLVIEKATPGARYHAVDEEGVALRDIAHAIGKYLKIPVVSKKPEEVAEHFGVMAHFATMDAPASGQKTREWLGWQPTGPSLLTDLGNMV